MDKQHRNPHPELFSKWASAEIRGTTITTALGSKEVNICSSIRIKRKNGDTVRVDVYRF